MKRLLVFIVALVSLTLTLGIYGCSTTPDNSNSSTTSSVKVWKIDYYVDEFNNPTNESFIKNSNYFIGTFSNSATTNSKLNVLILIDKNKTSIKLWEYGWSQVKGYSNTTYDITYLDVNGNRSYSSGTLHKNSDRIILNDLSLISLLQKNTELEIYIEEDSQYGYNSTYLFTIKRDNFNDIYNQYNYN